MSTPPPMESHTDVDLHRMEQDKEPNVDVRVELDMKVSPSSAPAMEVDVARVVGELGSFGCFQARTYAFILLPIVFSAIYNCQYVFTAAKASHRCVVPECEPTLGAEGLAGGPWAQWALPPGEARSCRRYRPHNAAAGLCTQEAFTNDTEPCDSRVYENHHSMVTTFDIGCAEWKRTLVGSVHSAGLLTALPLTGYMSDRYGRRFTLVVTAVSAGAVGVVRSFSTSYAMYLALEFLEATVGSGVYSTAFLLALETVGSSTRVLGGNVISATYALGQAACAGVAYGVPEWRTLTRVLYAPSLLFACYALLLHESVRWLLANGRRADARDIIFKAAEMNNKKLSPASIAALSAPDDPRPHPRDRGQGQGGNSAPASDTGIMRQVIHSRVMMSRLAICSFWWVTTTFIYYGLSINSVSLHGQPHLNYALMSLVELPGYALSVLTLDRFGRKHSIITAYALCGAVLVALPLASTELGWVSTALSMAGKLCISMAFSSIYIYTSELFPTAARHRLLATCSMVGRVGNLAAPQTPLLMRVTPSLPYLLFGGMSWCSALLMLLTPETLHAQLPDTVLQAEQLHTPDPVHQPGQLHTQQPGEGKSRGS